MGILARSDKISGSTINKYKIPDYARGYKKEYLFIKEREEFYNSYEALKIISKIKELKRLGYFNNIRRMKFEIDDVKNIEIIKSEIEEYRDLYCHKYTGKLNKELYNIEADRDNPGFKSFYKHFTRFYEEIKYRNEYLFIGGFNKTCNKFVKLVKEKVDSFDSYEAFRIINKIKEMKRKEIIILL